MRTLARNPIKHVREMSVGGEASNPELEERGRFLLSEFDLLESKAEADDLDVRFTEVARSRDTSSQVVDLINSVPFGAALHIEVTSPVNEGPVKEVTRIFVVKRQDGDVLEDTVTTYFQLGLEIGDNNNEEVKTAVLFNEILGENVRKETNLTLDTATGQLHGRHTLVKDGRERRELLDQKACDKDLVEAAETADKPIVEVVSHVTAEFDQIDKKRQSKLAVASEALKAARDVIHAPQSDETVQIDSLAA